MITQLVKNLPAMQETLVQFLGQQDPTLAQRRDMLPTPVFLGFPGGSDCKESACNAGDLGSVPRLGRFPWRRACQPTLVSLLGESPWTEEPGGLQSIGSRIAGN